MTNKRAQLSVETMIIYGLVILVTLSVIGGLLYFDIFDVGSYLPNQCDLGGSGDVRCEEMRFSADNSEIALGIRNTGQRPIASLNVEVTDTQNVHFDGTKNSDTVTVDGSDVSDTNALGPGEIARVIISTDDATAGEVLRAEVVTSYEYQDGAIEQETVGNLRIRAS